MFFFKFLDQYCLDHGEGAPDELADVVSTFCLPAPELEMKRSSKASLSPMRKKQKLHPPPPPADQERPEEETVTELVQRLEEYAEKLFVAVLVEEESSLGEENAKRLMSVRHKLGAILPQS